MNASIRPGDQPSATPDAQTRSAKLRQFPIEAHNSLYARIVREAFADVAAACGYASSLETDDLPRPSMSPVQVKTRLMRHIGVRAGVH
jgi:hypothetical protein